MPYDPYTGRPRLKSHNSLAVKLALLAVAAVALATGLVIIVLVESVI